MAVARDYPYGNAQFLVEIPSIPQAQAFDEVLLPDLSVEIEEVREGTERTPSGRKFPGLTKTSNLILRRGFTGRLELYQWWKMVSEVTPGFRQTITVSLLNEQREPVALWRFNGAFPTSYSFSPLNSLDGGPLIETLEVCCDSVAME